VESYYNLFRLAFFFLIFYLFDRECESKNTAGGVGEGKAGFPVSREPDVGLDLGS